MFTPIYLLTSYGVGVTDPYNLLLYVVFLVALGAAFGVSIGMGAWRTNYTTSDYLHYMQVMARVGCRSAYPSNYRDNSPEKWRRKYG